MRTRLAALLSLSVLAGGTHALSQPAPGGEFLVNTVTSNSQQHPKVARRYGAQGPGFLIVWESYGAFVTDIYAASFNALGVKDVGDFRVNSYLTGFQTYPTVAGAYDGTFTVAWESSQQDGTSYGIYAQRFSSAGVPDSATDILVSTYTTGSQRHPTIAPGGGATRLAFEGVGPGDTDGVFFSPSPFASESLVNVYTAGSQRSAGISGNIALLENAPDFLVVWHGNGADDVDQGIYGRVFDTAGSPFTADFRINATTTGGQTLPAVAANFFALGYVVVWETPNGGTTLRDVYAQRLEANGSPRGPEFRVNTYTTGNQDQPQVATDDYGNFVVVWSSYQDGSMRSVHAQAYAASGEPRGVEYRLNDYPTNPQRMPSVAATGGGEGQFVVVWQSFGQEGSNSLEGIYARLFTVPSAYAHGDANGDGVIDVLDVFYLINFLFAGGAAPLGSGDVNGVGGTDVQDIFYLINYLFAGGSPPA